MSNSRPHDHKKKNKEHSHHHKEHHHEDEKPSGISIFNRVTVNAPVEQTSANTSDSKKEDGCTGCFKALFNAVPRR